jgi:hypothetical protein
MRNLPPSEGEVMDEDPFLQGYVSFQTGAIETGAIVLALRLRPLPTMHFLLADEQAATLVKEVSQILATPMGMRFQSKKH